MKVSVENVVHALMLVLLMLWRKKIKEIIL